MIRGRAENENWARCSKKDGWTLRSRKKGMRRKGEMMIWACLGWKTVNYWRETLKRERSSRKGKSTSLTIARNDNEIIWREETTWRNIW